MPRAWKARPRFKGHPCYEAECLGRGRCPGTGLIAGHARIRPRWHAEAGPARRTMARSWMELREHVRTSVPLTQAPPARRLGACAMGLGPPDHPGGTYGQV